MSLLRILIAASLAAIAAACVAIRELELAPRAKIQTTILAVASPGDRVRLIAIDRRTTPPGVTATIGPHTIIGALHYERSLDTLQLAAGDLEILTEGRKLPRWDLAESWSSETWTELDPELEQILAAVHLADLDPFLCAAGGGCLSSARECEAPCPTPAAPEAPISPEPPHVATATCANGDFGIVAGRSPFCEPDPVFTCPPDQVRFAGEEICHAINRPCPAGDYAEDLPQTGVFYVHADAAPGGSGTLASPLTIGEALAIAPDGAIIALAKGEYEGPFALQAAVELRGACAAESTMFITAVEAESVIQVRASGARIVGVGFRGGGPAINVPNEMRSIDLDDVLIRAPGRSGIVARMGGSFTARDVFIVGRDGLGLGVESGATASAERVVIADQIGIGARAKDVRSTLVLRDFVVLGSREGAGLSVTNAAMATITAAQFRGALPSAIALSGDGTLDVNNAILTRTGTAPMTFAIAVNGGKIKGRDLLVEGFSAAGISLDGANSSAELGELVVRGGEDPVARGLSIIKGAKATFEDTIVARARTDAIQIDGAGTDVTFRRLIVRETQPGETATSLAISILAEATATFTEVILERQQWANVLVGGESTVSFTDAILRNTEDAQNPPGLVQADFVGIQSSELTLTRVAMEANPEIGLKTHQCNLFLSDVSIRGYGLTPLEAEDSTVNIERLAIDGAHGTCVRIRGMQTTLIASDISAANGGTGGFELDVPSSALITRMSLVGNGRYGMRIEGKGLLGGPGAYVIRDLAITDTSTAALCPDLDECETSGLRIHPAAAADIERFDIGGSVFIGVWAEGANFVRLADGVVHANQIGLRVTPEPTHSYDYAQLFERVLYEDNVRNLRLDKLR